MFCFYYITSNQRDYRCIPEVAEFEELVLVYEDVGWLDVAVEDLELARMALVQRTGQLEEERPDATLFHPLP